ncbi:hypothetical protein LTR36_005175 [Oleoguttula mirabilis]|uniref:Uncharacterized protein n=1 Tax=Oleoguttula mirabilis TaxID=1507867 RepID=A0AAV9JWF4_9PEZI|nr:hypothetical protein LTR36_005175 [Oleoguttula mirabilis]
MVLVSADRIQIDEQRPPPSEPALLRVHKQMRAEARAIYYKENTFRFHVNDFDITAVLRWYAVSATHRKCHHHYIISSSHDWPRLLAWLQAYYDGLCRSIGERRDNQACVVHSLFGMVREMKGEQALTWQQVAKNLEYVHQGLVATQSGW